MSDFYYAVNPADDNLFHYGIPGQKKGRRRFQNKDGSLTPLGRLRYLKGNDGTRDEVNAIKKEASDKAKELRSTAKREKKIAVAQKEAEKIIRKAEKKYTTPEKKKSQSVRKLSDQEIRERINRLNLEKDYREAVEKSKSKGERFVARVMESIGETAVKNIGSQLVNSGLAYLGNYAIGQLADSRTKKTLEDIRKNDKLSDEEKEKQVKDFEKSVKDLKDQYKIYTNNKKKDK